MVSVGVYTSALSNDAGVLNFFTKLEKKFLIKINLKNFFALKLRINNLLGNDFI